MDQGRPRAAEDGIGATRQPSAGGVTEHLIDRCASGLFCAHFIKMKFTNITHWSFKWMKFTVVQFKKKPCDQSIHFFNKLILMSKN